MCPLRRAKWGNCNFPAPTQPFETKKRKIERSCSYSHHTVVLESINQADGSPARGDPTAMPSHTQLECPAIQTMGRSLGARPRISRGRVPSAAGADARRRDAGDVSVHRRGAPASHLPPRCRNPKGAWGLRGDLCVARRQRCARTSPPPRALSSPRKPHARDPS